ncbi:MAG TPA: DsbE family thiol:disulfide interchange protein [Burkholderiaceae bacterium]|jgi:cytochrome c biogenesis protein CcmG/thiol:disulfide interchange protein DsbE|nr:DsbE family thiol:disulfide interchange protein [Burkholderiaceae bacterium]
MKRVLLFLIPLTAFLLLVVFLGVGLNRDPREIPSPFIGKPAPNFTLTQLQAPDKTFSPKDMEGKVWLLNVWASWCVACREEHPVLLDFSKLGVVPIMGLNYKDGRKEGTETLDKLGDPYQLSAFDADGRVGIDYGVYGVPETFVIDKHGVIRYKQIGPVTPEVISEKLLPLIKELNRA